MQVRMWGGGAGTAIESPLGQIQGLRELLEDSWETGREAKRGLEGRASIEEGNEGGDVEGGGDHMTELPELVSGEETDRMVAVAVGWQPVPGTWLPSTDWTDAMEAAAKVKLFEKHVLGSSSSLLWTITEVVRRTMRLGFMIAYAESGPLCICRAIVKLKGDA